MREVLRFLFDRFTDPLGLPIVWYWEWFILAIIAFAAYAIAFRSVGDLYDGGMISGSAAGSVLHWIIRLIVFVVIWAVTYFCDLACKAYFCTLAAYCNYPWRHSGDCCNYLSDCSLYPKRW